MGSIAASGGYYIACAADTILANPGSLTGSIGVIFSFFEFQNLMNKVGVKLEVVKSGKLKDIGNPSRELTSEERAMLQSVIDDTYEQFIGVVAERRSLELDYVLKLADGSVFTGKQAVVNGLVDKLGTLEDAIATAGALADLGKQPRVIKEKRFRRTIFDELLGFIGLDIRGHDNFMPALEYRFSL